MPSAQEALALRQETRARRQEAQRLRQRSARQHQQQIFNDDVQLAREFPTLLPYSNESILSNRRVSTTVDARTVPTGAADTSRVNESSNLPNPRYACWRTGPLPSSNESVRSNIYPATRP